MNNIKYLFINWLENVIFSCELKKINDKNSPQIRSLVLTNKKIYNLKAKSNYKKLKCWFIKKYYTLSIINRI